MHSILLMIPLASGLAFASPGPDLTAVPDPTTLAPPPIEFPLVQRVAALVDRADDLVHVGLIAAAVVAPGLWEHGPSTSSSGLSIDLNSRRRIEDPRTWSPPPKKPTLRFTSDLGDHDAPGVLWRSRW